MIGEFHLAPREAMEKHVQAQGWKYGAKSSMEKKQTPTLKKLGLDKDLIGPAPTCELCSTIVPCEDSILLPTV